MTSKVVFSSAAKTNILGTRRWYESRREGLGDEFMAAVHSAVDWIGRHPLSYATEHRDIRACLTKGFPYVIYYRVEADQVVIIDVLHGSRDQSMWKSK